jgi:hypothetical protein
MAKTISRSYEIWIGTISPKMLEIYKHGGSQFNNLGAHVPSTMDTNLQSINSVDGGCMRGSASLFSDVGSPKCSQVITLIGGGVYLHMFGISNSFKWASPHMPHEEDFPTK